MKLRKNQLYTNRKKSIFYPEELEFLGHIISDKDLKLDLRKIQAIKNWKLPKTHKDVIFLLRLANYYRKFIRNFSKFSSFFTSLMKKDIKSIK